MIGFQAFRGMHCDKFHIETEVIKWNELSVLLISPQNIYARSCPLRSIFISDSFELDRYDIPNLILFIGTDDADIQPISKFGGRIGIECKEKYAIRRKIPVQ